MNSLKQPLTNAQQELLALFGECLTDEDMEELRRWLLEFRYRRLQGTLEKAAEEKGWTEKTFEEWGNTKFRKPYQSLRVFNSKVADEGSH